MKKIVFVIESLGPGGAERQLVGLALNLLKEGYEVSVIYYDDVTFYKGHLEKANIKIIYCPQACQRWSRPYYINKELTKISPDFVISFLPGPNFALSTLSFVKRKKYKLILSERSHTVWTLKNRILYLLYSRCDIMVANSESEAENIRKHCFFLRDKTIAITNFVDTDLFHPEEELHKVGDYFRLLCVARIRSVKNIIRFLDAIKMLKERGVKIKVNWYGRGYKDDYEAQVNSRIKDNNISDIIDFLPPSKDIASIYRNNDGFCLPSLYEGYPNVLVEAMSSGLPVACSNVWEFPNIVSDGNNGFLFDPYKVEDIADGIEKLTKLTYEQRLKISKINREQIINQNSISVFTKKYLKIL